MTATADASQMPDMDRRARRGITAMAACLVVAVLLVDVLFYSNTQEDAFITFRYSRHLAEGHGVGAWNTTGEVVEGYTSTLWMLWLGLAPVFGMKIETLAKLSGVTAQLGLCLLLALFPLWRKVERAGRDLPGADPDVFLLAALGFGLYLPACWYATSGMEALPFALFVGLALLLPACTENRAAIALVFAGLVLMRPEGAPIAAALAGLLAFTRWREKRALAPALAAASAVVVSAVALTGFRLAHFGEFVPNTYFAKTAGADALHLRLGLIYLQDWLSHHLAWLPFLAAATVAWGISVARRGLGANAALAGILGLGVGYGLYALRVGGDNPTAFPYWRQLLHAAPALCLALGMGITAITRSRRLRFALLAAVLALTNYQVIGAHNGRMSREIRDALATYPNLRHEPHNEYYRWLDEISGPDTVIASPAAGELPFVVDAVHIDMLGLNDREVAHRGTFDPDGPVDSKSDIDSVMRRRPDIIQSTLTGNRFEKVSPRLNRIVHRGEMEADLLNHPDFKEEYLFVRNAPYAVRDRAIFVRRSFWTTHPLRDMMRCVPVTQTAIYPRK